MRRFLLLALFCLGLTGCTTTTLTNLTPRQQQRNANNLYPVEVMWTSQQATIVSNTVKGFVVVGTDMYPMQRSPMLPNRWETVLPVPADKDLVNYFYKFDYEFLQIPVRRPGSLRSAPYQMQITDR
jgi:hypothetical protein